MLTIPPDRVMAEYVLIMLINKKSPGEQKISLILSSCLQAPKLPLGRPGGRCEVLSNIRNADRTPRVQNRLTRNSQTVGFFMFSPNSHSYSPVIGPDTWDSTFVDWLFVEASRENPGSAAPIEEVQSSPAEPTPTLQSIQTVVHDQRDSRRNGPPPRLYNQAMSGAQKRNRSQSPPSNGPNKLPRRTDTPSRPRAMRDGLPNNNERSLKDRLGGFGRDQPQNNMGPGPRFPPGGPMPPMGPFNPEMAGMNPNFAMTEMIVQQNALLQGLLHTMANGMQMPLPGMPGMPGMPSMGPGGFPFNGPPDQRNRQMNRGPNNQQQGPPGAGPSIQAPQPVNANASNLPPDIFDRPISPSLCKFGVKCTNALCRWSHPSSAATAESGIVLSTEACPAGRKCQNKDCTLSHPSAGTSTCILHFRGVAHNSVTDMSGPMPHTRPQALPAQAQNSFANTVPCKFGVNCTRPGCPYSHPAATTASKSTIPCKFGIQCTRADCIFSHPPGRTNPASFKGLSGPAPEKTHANRTMRFNTSAAEFVPKEQAGTPQASAGGSAGADKGDGASADANPEVIAAR